MVSVWKKLPIIPHTIWTRVIIIAWIALATMPLARGAAMMLTPASKWLDVHAVYVSDAWVGECPVMHVRRQINRDFVGRFTATLHREVDPDDDHREAGWVIVPPTSTSVAPYRVGARLPNPLMLDWWMEWKTCPVLAPGRYSVTTVWSIEPDGIYSPQVTAISNVFTIRNRSGNGPIPLLAGSRLPIPISPTPKQSLDAP